MDEPSSRPLLLIANTTAGSGRARHAIRRAVAALDAGRRPFRIELSTSAEHASELSRESLETKEIPVAVGGDGQVASVAAPLVRTGEPMGILPCGRGNDLARGLGIPEEPEPAVAILAGGRTRSIDVGRANGELFLGIASVGFDSRANEFANRAHFLPGRTVYAWSAIRALFGWKAVRFTVIRNGSRQRVEAHTIAVANNRFYGGGMKMAPSANLSDGLLDLIIVGNVPRIRFLAEFPKVFAGRHIDGVHVTAEKVQEAEIESVVPLVLYADGDPLTELPARVRVLPAALDVITPEGNPP